MRTRTIVILVAGLLLVATGLAVVGMRVAADAEHRRVCETLCPSGHVFMVGLGDAGAESKLDARERQLRQQLDARGCGRCEITKTTGGSYSPGVW